MDNVSTVMTDAMAAMTAVTVPMNMTAPGNAMTVISSPVQMVHALPSRLNAMITKTAQMAAMNPIVLTKTTRNARVMSFTAMEDALTTVSVVTVGLIVKMERTKKNVIFMTNVVIPNSHAMVFV